MKRSVSLILALLLALSPAFCAAAEGVPFKTSYYTLTLPDGWIIDTDDLESGDDYEDLGYFYAPEEIGLLVVAYLEYYEELKDFSLWNADASELRDYTQSVLEDLEEFDPEPVGTVMAGGIPFVVVKGTDADGDFLYADTMTNGYAIVFEAYVTDMDGETVYPLTEDDVEQFNSILASFLPVT